MNMDELLERAKDAYRHGGNPSVDILAICRMMHAHHHAVRKALEAKIAGQRRVGTVAMGKEIKRLENAAAKEVRP